MYSIRSFGGMINDSVRMDAYVRALQCVVRPDTVVLDIGTGAGIFAVLAHRLGARRVIAIEPNDAICIAREIAAANGCAKAIEFHQAMSTEISLSEPADVILSDLRGVLPFFQQNIPTIVDARKRLLAPGGVLIPQRDEIWISIVEDAEAYKLISSPWTDNTYDIDMSAASRLLANQSLRIEATAEQLLAEPAMCGSLDYATIEDADFSASVRLPASRDGTAHGLCVWFDTLLVGDIGFTNAPGLAGAARPIYRNAFFPFVAPVPVCRGDVIEAKLQANLVGDDYVWRWSTVIGGPDGEHPKKASFRQSSLGGEPFSPARMARRSADHVPELSDSASVDKAILNLMGEGLSLGAIALRVSALDGVNLEWKQVLAKAGELSLRYGK